MMIGLQQFPTLIPTCSAHAVNFVHPFCISQPAIQMISGTIHLQGSHVGQPTGYPHTLQQSSFQPKKPIQAVEKKEQIASLHINYQFSTIMGSYFEEYGSLPIFMADNEK